MDKHKIVLVDDDKNILDSLSRILWQEDREFIKFSDAIESWDYIKSQNGQIDIIISDNRMPDLDGVDLLVALKKRYPDIIRIMLTGESDLSDAQKAINQGRVYKFITKPCDPDILNLIIKHALSFKKLFFQNRRLIEQIKKQKEIEKGYSEIGQLMTDNDGRIIIEEEDYISFEEFMKEYFK